MPLLMILFFGIGLFAVVLYLGIEFDASHWRRWALLGVILALPVMAGLYIWSDPAVIMQSAKEQARPEKEQELAAARTSLNEH